MKNNYPKETIQTLINNFNARNYDFVISKTKSCLKKYPQIIIFYNLLGSSYQGIGKFEEAIDIFNNGLKIDSNNIYISNNLANCYKYLLNYKKAEELLTRIIEKNPKYTNAYINLGNLKRDINKFDSAIKFYEIADKISPNNHIILYLLALAHQGLGNFEISINYAKKVLAINPNFTKADYLISQSMKYEDNSCHYEDLNKKMQNKNLNDEEKINLYFSLAKANEDLNKIEESSKFLKIGNAIGKTLNKYDLNRDRKLFEDIKETFNNLDLKKNNNNEVCKIIFILGMPRSGTSLLEQIVSSHSNVVGGGELPIMTNIVNKNFIKDGLLEKDAVLKIINNPLQIKEISNQYINYVNYFDIKQKFIVDKSPLNFLWIGFIKIFFPNVKIIHCYREPKNNCLSMYKNLFENNLKFSYDENNMVEFYKMYQDLMKFWQFEKNINLIDVSYENLITNNESEIKRIIEDCDLDWDEKCLNYYNSKNPIKTMSAAQARKPLYKSSVNNFDKYKIFLKKVDDSF